MVTLVVGDRVSDRKGTHEGKLVDIEGTTGYVMQANGVEIEFPLSELKPWEAPKVAESKTLQGPLRDTVLSPEKRRLLASVPADVMAAISKSYDAGAGDRPAFASLPESKKLDTVRIYMPSLPQRLLSQHMNLVIAMRDLAKTMR